MDNIILMETIKEISKVVEYSIKLIDEGKVEQSKESLKRLNLLTSSLKSVSDVESLYN